MNFNHQPHRQVVLKSILTLLLSKVRKRIVYGNKVECYGTIYIYIYIYIPYRPTRDTFKSGHQAGNA